MLLFVNFYWRFGRKCPALEVKRPCLVIKFIYGREHVASFGNGSVWLDRSIFWMCDRVVFNDNSIRIPSQSLDICFGAIKFVFHLKPGKWPARKLVSCHVV